MSLGIVLLILVPVAEVWTAVQLAQRIGWPATIVLLIVISACGPRLVRSQGTGVWRRAQHRMGQGEVPGREAVDGVLLLMAGVALTFPGFITGVLGALLVLPPVRTAVRNLARVWLARKVRRSAAPLGLSVNGRDIAERAGPVVAVESHPLDRPDRPD